MVTRGDKRLGKLGWRKARESSDKMCVIYAGLVEVDGMKTEGILQIRANGNGRYTAFAVDQFEDSDEKFIGLTPQELEACAMKARDMDKELKKKK